VSSDSIQTRAGDILRRLREQKPLVHQITNFVVMNDTANVTLQVGALPVMAHAPEEMEEMVSLAGALVLNTGTLERPWIDAMITAGKHARLRGIPVVLDPVGAGATSYRTDTDLLIIRDVGPDIVRGNPGEIAALIGAGGEVRGVESVGTLDDPVAVAKLAANAWGATVAMTGARDLITDGSRTLGVENGDRWLTTLTGTGCSSTAMVAAYAAVESDYVLAAAGALAHLGYAAEVAAKDAKGPGSFKAALHDAIYNMTPDMLAENMRAVELG